MSRPPGTRGLVLSEPVIFTRSRAGRSGYSVPAVDVPAPEELPDELQRRDELAGLPELSEVEVVRHFTRLSTWNYGVDHGLYPLGSCTMKYNPKVNELIARRPGFAQTHPLAPESQVQGALALIHGLGQALAEISGFAAVTLQPAAGAHGELTGLMMVRKHHLTTEGTPRKKVLVPDTAHGTNPASSTLNGYRTVQIPSGPDGVLLPADVAAAMDEDVAALMLTNPNTLGLFETHIAEVAEIVHAKGGLVYCDGANLNALLGIARPGDMGVDVMQFNLHKTFSTPHGGGGPGSGPVGVAEVLTPYLPSPVVTAADGGFTLDWDRPESIGMVRSFYGNFGVMVRAFTYLAELGADGLKRVAELAVLNANYLRVKLREHYHLTHDRTCMHECVLSDKKQKVDGVKTLDIAKRLIELGYHPPTIYFPLVIEGALMIEPTETESLEVLDEFVAAMIQIAEEAADTPELVTAAPQVTRLGRLDETAAARHPVLTWEPDEG